MSVINKFLGGNGLGAFREMDMAHFPVDFGAERGGDGVQAGGGDFLQVTLVNFLLQFFKLTTEDFPAFVALAEDALGQILGLGGAEIGNFKLMLAAPLDEGGLGKLQFHGNAVEAPALRAQENEAGDGFGIGHVL